MSQEEISSVLPELVEGRCFGECDKLVKLRPEFFDQYIDLLSTNQNSKKATETLTKHGK